MLEPTLRRAADLLALGDARGADALLRAALTRAKAPSVELLLGASTAAAALHDWPRALHLAERALAQRNTDPAPHLQRARVLHRSQRREQACAALALGIERCSPDSPDHAELFQELAMIQLERSLPVAALGTIARGLEAHPHDARTQNLHSQRAHALLASGDASSAAALAATLAARGDVTAACLHAMALQYTPGVAPAQLRDAHAAAGAMLLALARATLPAWSGPPPATDDASGPARLVLLSPELRAHPIASFLPRVLAGLDRSRLRVIAVHTGAVEDQTSALLRASVDEWHHLPAHTPGAVLATLRSLSPHTVLELAGLTNAAHLLPIAAMTADAARGPRVLSYLGYPGGTGLAGVRARVVDAWTDPPALDARPHAVEPALRLPRCFLCYQPPAELARLDVSPPPSARAGHATFASIGAWPKVNAPLATLWRRVLEAAPTSRLIIKCAGFAEEALLVLARRRCEAWGLPMDRVTLAPASPTHAEHALFLSRVDVLLDTHPYHGTTTTCESLWMGVPVVTLAGEAHAARVGASLLAQVGLDDLVCASADEFVARAAALATDEPRRARLRQELRARTQDGPLGDASALAQALTGAVLAG